MHVDYLEQIEYFNRNKVYSFQIESNLSCQQACLYCYASDDGSPLKEMPSEDIRSLLEAAAMMDVRAIDWLGGDPLTRKDWYALMKYGQQLGLVNNIWTSGIPLANEVVARQAVEVTEEGFISVHLDTLDETIHRQLQSGKDPHRRMQFILKGVEIVQSLGKNPANMINCITFTTLVARDVDKTIRYFHEKGMQTCLTQICRTGLARNHPEWIPSPEEIKAACEIRDRIDYPSSEVSFCTMDVNKYYCGGTVCITVDGDVTPCSVIRKSAGNIHDRPLETIIDEHKGELLMTRLRNPEGMPGNCVSCASSDICWGCRAMAYYETGDLYGPDPKCYKNDGQGGQEESG